MAPNRSSWAPLFLVLLFSITLFFTPALSVKKHDFKTCDQSGFCKRNRAYAKEASEKGNDWVSPYALDASTIKFHDGSLTGTVLKTINTTSGETVRLPLTVSFLESGVARVTLDEEKRQKGDIVLRHDSKARKDRSNEAQKWAIVGGLQKSSGAAISKDTPEGTTRVLYGDGGKHEAIIQHRPFRAEFKRNGDTQIILNDHGLMSMEHWRPKIEKPLPPPEKKEGEENKEGEDKKEEEKKEPEPQGPDESTWWDESFGGNTDSKPKGPESVGMDFTFYDYEHVYGIPEHTGPLSLKDTSGGDGKYDDPYRLYNTDVFEYEMDSPMTLYGAIPFMQAHKRASTCGIFWLNAAETWIDIRKLSSKNPLSNRRPETRTHWFSESGLLDVFVLLGPTPRDMSRTYGELTGYTALPPQFAIAYHQCRWNYITDDDVRDVDRKFDRHHIPYDVIWLDLEYLDNKKFFTWDPMQFADPTGMQQQLDAHGRKLVALIDPHMKKEDGYFAHDELKAQDLGVHQKDGTSTWEGWCWPGAAYWVDMFNPAAQSWWTSLFRYEKWVGSAPNTHIWNDMNEPSVFNGPETTMPKDNIHYHGYEHRDVHNVNGLTFVNATYAALQVRDDPKGKTPTRRPFVLTRSFYAGSQRMGAMWTGDNQAQWSHLAASLPMVLQNGVSGFPFAGADVGGFFGNPSTQLLVRWYQAGAFYPFFRGHAHIDTRRREPYLAPEPERTYIAQAIRLRYALLPTWYTAFHRASLDGAPIVRPMWWAHPADPAGFPLDDQMYLGDSGLLVRPATEENADSVYVYLPAADAGAHAATPYYDYWDYTVHPSGVQSGRTVKLDAPLSRLPLLMRAGHIFTRRDRPRRSSTLMTHDPLTIVVVLDPTNPRAQGELYLDDGATYAYRGGARLHRKFIFENAALRSEDVDVDPTPSTSSKAFARAKDEYLASMEDVLVEKIILVGAPPSWKGVERVSVSEEGGGVAQAGKQPQQQQQQKVMTSVDGARTAEMQWHAGAKGTADWAVVRAPGVRVGRGWRVGV